MEKLVTSAQENNGTQEQQTSVDQEVKANLTDTKETNLRYKSVEEAEKAKNETDAELAKYTNFVKVLTQEGAEAKLESMYAVDPDMVNRFYKKTFNGKTFEEAKAEVSQQQEDLAEKESNPELYALKKQISELQSKVDTTSTLRQADKLDSFIAENPQVTKESLQAELAYISTDIPMEKRLVKAYNILAAEGKLDTSKVKADIQNYKQQSAAIIGLGNGIRQDVINSQPTQLEKITAKFNDKSTLPPSFRNI